MPCNNRYTYRINLTVYADSGDEADQVVADWIASSPHPATSFPEGMSADAR